MENSPLGTKFKTLLQKTGKINFDFNIRNETGNHGSADSSRIPAEWVGLVGVSGGGRRDEGVFVADEGLVSTADDEILSGMEAAYVTDDFDPTLFELEGLDLNGELNELSQMVIDERRKTLLRQLKVVTKKAYAQILEKRPDCVKEMTKVRELEDSLVLALDACSKSRHCLESARSGMSASSLGMLAAAKRRQRINKLIQNLTIIATLQKTDVRLQELLSEGDYPAAIQLLLEAQQAVKTYNHFAAIRQLAVKLQDTLDFTEEKLDVALSKVCCNFNAEEYRKIQDAYRMLGKTQTSMDQLQMHITSAVHNTAWNVAYGHAMLSNPAEVDASKRSYQDICAMIADDSLVPCLLDLCKALWLLMRSYKQIVTWHKSESDPSSSADHDLDAHLERQYVQRKLTTGLTRIWQDVQAKIRILVVAKEVGTKMRINEFLHLMHIIHRLIEFGHEFCGSNSDTLQESLKAQCSTYFSRYHRQRLEDLKMHFENEGWALCPVRSNFGLLQLREFQEVREAFSDRGSPLKRPSHFLSPRRQLSTSMSTSSVSPFDEIFDDQVDGKEEDVFIQTDDESFNEHDSDLDEDHELSKSAINEDGENEATIKRSSIASSPLKPRQSRRGAPIVTNTSLMLLRLCGNYVHLMYILRPISGSIFKSLTTLIEFYVAVVHSFFAVQDLQSDSPSYFGYGPISPRLQTLLSKIRTNLFDTDSSNNDTSTDRHFIEMPQMSFVVRDDLSDTESLNGLSEKYVAVESTLFIVEQLKKIRPIIDQLVLPEDMDDVEAFFSQTVPVFEDLRRPVYWSAASSAFSFDFLLSHMNKVSWDIKEVKSQHSQYVDLLLRELQIFCIRLQSLQEKKISISGEVQKTLWDLIVLAASFLFVEGFSAAKKCSNEGRALMQLDFRQFVLKLESIAEMRPLPHQDLVTNYIKAYYIPEMELEDWVKLHVEYTPKQLLSLVNCVAYNNNKTKQRLDAIISELSTIKISIRK